MTTPFVSPKFRATTAAGFPLSFGKVFTYAAGTLTPLVSYTDAAATMPNTNPVILDSTGRASIWLKSGVAYKIVVQDSDGNAAPDGTVDGVFQEDLALYATQQDLGLYPTLARLALGTGAALVGFKQSGTGAVAQTVEAALSNHLCVFDFMMLTQIADVKAGTLALDHTAAIQSAINASYGRKLFFPKGAYKITSELSVLVNTNAGVNNLGVHLYGEAMGPISGVLSGTRIQVIGAVNCFNVFNSLPTPGDARIIIEDMMIYGDGANAAGGSGITATRANNMILRNLFVQDFRAHGIYLFQCFGSSVDDCTILRSRLWGIWANEAFNLGSVRRTKIYGCGRAFSTIPQGGLYLSGTGNDNLGVCLENVDCSYSGFSGYTLFKRVDASLTSVSVTAGVATMTTAAAHNLTSGMLISLVGATVSAVLNTSYPAVITVTGTNTATFATNAPNGTYVDSTMVIGPASYGFLINSTRGLVLHGYGEESTGPALFIGNTTTSFEVVGGYWQGLSGSGNIIVDSAQRGRFAAMYLNGLNARLFIAGADGPNDVNVCNSITYQGGATLNYGATHVMKEGVYYATAIPTTGTWATGARVVRNPPAVGQPKAWTCTVAGTPGTWVSEGNL